jgi:heme A synthase
LPLLLVAIIINMEKRIGSDKAITWYAWFVLGYTLLVILWGAFVRATGSGAGCGSHWPLCNGVVIPRAAELETLIEFSHRLTSALNGMFVLILLVWVWRYFTRGHIARWGAASSTFFIITEGLVGAGLVLFELVADNASQARAIFITVHLVNTFLLLASLTLTAWWVSGGQSVRWRNQGAEGRLLVAGFLALLLVGASGAVTALGDTLFPSGSLAEGVQQDFSSTAHFLVRLRIWHPVLAVFTGIYLLATSSLVHKRRPGSHATAFRRAVQTLVALQLTGGVLNVLLLAPVWMQLVHLLLADLLWIALTLFAAAEFAQEAPTRAPVLTLKPTGD